MKRLLCVASMVVFCAAGSVARIAAQERPAHQREAAATPKETAVSTNHTIQLDGRAIPYTATAGIDAAPGRPG